MRTVHGMMWVLWPSFMVAGIGEMAFFAMFDPADLSFFGRNPDFSRTTIYSAGFFCFWALTAASSALTCILQSGVRKLGA